jgi:hypothetical protein
VDTINREQPRGAHLCLIKHAATLPSASAVSLVANRPASAGDPYPDAGWGGLGSRVDR